MFHANYIDLSDRKLGTEQGLLKKEDERKQQNIHVGEVIVILMTQNIKLNLK